MCATQDSTIEHELPDDLRRAAHDYLARAEQDSDPEISDRRLITAFGNFTQRNESHRRATWLCLLAAQRALSWPGHPFDPDACEDHRTVDTVQQWIADGVAPSNWDRICNRPGIVHQVGEVMDDDDTIANMVCALARFSLHHGVPDAVDALVFAWLLDNEYARDERRLMQFDQWLITLALPAAYNLRVLPNAELHPRLDR